MSGTSGQLTNPAAQHQAYQLIPNLDYPLVNQDGTLTIPWTRFFVNLWRRIGGSTTDLNATNVVTTQVGGAEQPQNFTANPFVFSAQSLGTMLVTRKYSTNGGLRREAGGDIVEFSRDNGVTWQLAGGCPMAMPLSAKDQLRVSWFSPSPPMLIWLPIV
jgi:hypothetical protein